MEFILLTTPFIFRLSRIGPNDERLPPLDESALHFIIKNSDHTKAVACFRTLIKRLHEHPDWRALHAFFTKRYSLRMLSGAPKLKTSANKLPYKVAVNIDTTKVGLPSHFLQLLSGGVLALTGAISVHPLSSAIAPAIGDGIGMQIMDLCYTGKDRRGRTFRDWEKLWKAIEGWVRVLDAARAQAGDISYTVKENPSNAKDRPVDISPTSIRTDSILSAQSVTDAFSQISTSPSRFREWETEYLDDTTHHLFLSRFPVDGPLDVYQGGPKAHACPSTMNGDDWAAWAQAVPLGSIIVPKTHFEARWSAVLLAHRDLPVSIKKKGYSWDACREQDLIYM